MGRDYAGIEVCGAFEDTGESERYKGITSCDEVEVCEGSTVDFPFLVQHT